MKKFIGIIIVFLVFNSIYGQKESLLIGNRYIFTMKNGYILKGTVNEIKNDSITVEYLNSNSFVKINNNQILSFEKFKFAENGSIGLGIGIPYGIFGINCEVAVFKYFSFTGGIGTTVLAGVGYNLGGKFYFTPPSKKWRPRLSGYYGTNSIIYIEQESIGESFNGFSIGVGLCALLLGERRNHGFDIDLIYIATQGDYADRIQEFKSIGYQFTETGTIKISLGYRFGF